MALTDALAAFEAISLEAATTELLTKSFMASNCSVVKDSVPDMLLPS